MKKLHNYKATAKLHNDSLTIDEISFKAFDDEDAKICADQLFSDLYNCYGYIILSITKKGELHK